MARLLALIDGRKTYIVATAFTVYAALGYGLGQIDASHAFDIVMTSGLGATLRHAVDKSQAPA